MIHFESFNILVILHRAHFKQSDKLLSHFLKILNSAADYFVLLGATVVHDATGEVGVTCGAPTLQICFFLPEENTDKHYSRLINVLFPPFF